ncbi:MAG TPA: aminoglycoside phosphotransferase family protein [Candidatus Saccharimonadales bacterium]
MDDHFEKNALSYGEEGAAWLKNIPALIEEHEQQWSVEVLAPFPLSYNYVAPVTRADGTQAVLKIGYPTDREFKSEIAALKVFNGEGIAQLLEADEEKSVILIERITPGNALSSLDDDNDATKIIARVMRQLHKPLPANHKFITIEDWASAIPQYKKWYTAEQSPLPMSLVTKAEQLFERLIATSAPAMLVHGDLHHDNILDSGERGWVAIDPKGIAAEPAYEVAAMIRNPYEKLKEVTDLAPLLRQRIITLSQELNFDPQRILDWCFAQTMLSAVWSVGEVKGPEHALRVAQTLDILVL